MRPLDVERFKKRPPLGVRLGCCRQRLHREHVEHEVGDRDPAAAVQHPRAQAMEVRAAVVVERDDLPVELQVRRQRPLELGQLRRHGPASTRPCAEAGVGADQAPVAVQLRLEQQPRACGNGPERARIGPAAQHHPRIDPKPAAVAPFGRVRRRPRDRPRLSGRAERVQVDEGLAAND
jgi:hypothetical protein